MSLTNEEKWKIIPSAPTYEVSTFGCVRKTSTKKLCRISNHSAGYNVVGLYESPIERTEYVHRLVTEAFIGKCPIGYEVNHLDCNRKNNNFSNLEYVTRKQNLVYASTLRRTTIGERNRHAKLDEASVLDILRVYSKATQKGKRCHKSVISYLSNKYSISRNHVCNIGRRIFWKHLMP